MHLISEIEATIALSKYNLIISFCFSDELTSSYLRRPCGVLSKRNVVELLQYTIIIRNYDIKVIGDARRAGSALCFAARRR